MDRSDLPVREEEKRRFFSSNVKKFPQVCYNINGRKKCALAKGRRA